MKLLSLAKEDEYGRLYILNCYGRKVYFGIMETINEDLFEMNHGKEFQNTDTLYDRHFWNDDTFEAHVISKHELDCKKYDGKYRYPVLNKEEQIMTKEEMKDKLMELGYTEIDCKTALHITNFNFEEAKKLLNLYTVSSMNNTYELLKLMKRIEN